MSMPPVSPPRRSTSPRGRVNLTEDNQSLINLLRSAVLTPQETETCLQSLFNLMTRDEVEGEGQFMEVISALERNDLRTMASFLTSSSDCLLEIARNENGSCRLRDLFRKSDDVDMFFFAAILCRFVDVMTDKNACNVAISGMRVFNEEKRKAMHPHIVFHAVHLACDRRGYITLKRIITNLGNPNLCDPFYRDELLDKVASNALFLSYDDYGNYVVQHVLQMCGLVTTRKVAYNLIGHFIELSHTKGGSYIVQLLLKTVESRPMVVAELLECDEHRLMMLACCEYGNFVVGKALRVTQKEINIRPDLFWWLVNKLMPFYHHLLTSPGRSIAKFLDSIDYS